MRAAVVPGFGQPLVIEDRPVPDPGPGQVAVRMEASGLCHTDIHAANGDWPVTPTVPFIPGHEGVGIVTAAGDGVISPQVGQRVAVPWLGYELVANRLPVTHLGTGHRFLLIGVRRESRAPLATVIPMPAKAMSGTLAATARSASVSPEATAIRTT